MGKKVIHGGLILRATLASGSGHDLLTVNPSTGEVGSISGTPLTTTLTAGSIFLGNASNVATATAMSGDVTINSSGATAIEPGVIVNADINASAAIAHSKMAALTASRALVSDGSGVASVSVTTSTELGYVSGVTSAIQTQINGKQATITGAATTIVSADLTANRALISGSLGKVEVSTVTNTELGYLSGVTSNIQTQFSGKLSATIAGAATGDILYYNGTAWVNLPKGTDGQTLRSSAATILWDTPTINGIPVGGTANQVLSKNSGTDFDASWTTLTVSRITDLTATAAELNVLDGITATVTELNYVDGVTSNIQTQLDAKQSSALAHNALWVGNSSGVASTLSPGTNGYVLTISSGAPSWQPVSAGTTPGSDTQVLFNDGGAFGADAGLVYNKTNDILTIGSARIFTPVAVNNLFVGNGAGNLTLSGTHNIGIGYQALDANTTGAGSIAVGSDALGANTTGTNNIAVGFNAGLSNTTGSQNIFIGHRAGLQVSDITGNQNVLIGFDIDVQSVGSSGQLSIQNALFGLSNSSVGASVSTGTLGVYVAAPTASLDIVGSTTSKASLRIRSGSAPTSPNDGDIWQDGTSIYIRLGGVTKTFTLT